MDIGKLKLDKFKNIQLVNFPKDIDLGIKAIKEKVDVIIYYIKEIEDIERCLLLVNSTSLPKENRVILVYEKGRKDAVNRDSIVGPFKTKKVRGFKPKTPMLCSISKRLSAFVLSKES